MFDITIIIFYLLSNKLVRKGFAIMSFSSKKTIAGILTGVLIVGAYIIYALSNHAPSPDDLKGWAIAMLIFIGIGVVAAIIIQIAYHIAFAIGMAIKEQVRDDKTIKRIFDSETAEDERDKMITLKSSHTSHSVTGIGFVAALIALALGVSAVMALHIILGAVAFGQTVGGILDIYFYEKGV